MDGGFLAFIGFGLMLGLSGIGSAIATGMTGSGVVGLLKKRPETFGSALVLAAVPSTQALYGFVGFIIFQGALGTGNIDLSRGSIVLGAGFALGLVCFLSAIFQAKVSCSGISAIASGHDVFGNTLILIAFPEFFAILSLVSAIMISQMITPEVAAAAVDTVVNTAASVANSAGEFIDTATSVVDTAF
jgi:V/A-type H+-transporting ATPase subunit K